MDDLTQKVARRYLKTAGLKTAAERGISPNRLVDLMTLTMAFDSLADWAVDTETNPGTVGKKGLMLVKRFSSGLDEGIQEHLGPLAERGDGKVLGRHIRIGLRPGAPSDMAQRKGAMFGKVLKWMKSRQTVLRDVFPAKASRPAIALMRVSEEEDPVARMAGLAGIPVVSGATTIRKWVKEAASMMGVTPTATEEAMTDAESVAPLADELRRVNGLLEASDPVSETAADLQAKRAALLDKIDEAANDSVDPATVRASAVSAVAEQPTSKIAKKAGLNDEQTAALLAEGKVVITAGAGAGKTRVLAAKVAWFVEEKGYRPDQILATSFTNKAAKELKERVEDQYGINDARIGTTHNISREILFDFSNIPRDVIMKATKSGLISTLMKMAIEQVKLSQHSGGGRTWGGGGGRRWAGLVKDAAGPSPYWKKPIGEWFNIGKDPVDNRNKPIGTRRISTAVGMFQSHQISPAQAWAENKSGENGNVMHFAAAVYGAYDWLKHNDPQYGPALDFDDWLGEAVNTLKENPRALEALQRRFKVVMVDEAQDLNKVQHELFGLIAAKADTFAMIGDDKQAIYAFRGAVPDEFTALPGKGFKTETLTMNFRSGKDIVEAANKLIAHNGDRQIPMTCRADEERKGMGQIQAIELERHEDCAVLAANEISEEIETGGSPSDFGVLVRNNGEADAFCLALMAKGIPFRSKANFFNKPAVKALSAWITIAAGTSDSAINEAVVNAHSTPGFFLNRAFEAGLGHACPPGQNYLDFLLDGGRPYAGRDDWRNDKMVRPYADELANIKAAGTMPTADMIMEILDIRGSKQTFMSALTDQVDPEDVAEANDTLEPTDEMIREAALSPLRPMTEMAKKFTDPAKFIDFLTKMTRANDRSRKDDNAPEPAVMVDTIHQWKGLQAKNVYCVMAAGTFPHSSTDQKFAEGDETAYDDERRLAYVAITRGEDRVTVLSPKTNYMGKESGLSQFVSEACIGIRGETVEEADPDAQDETMLKMAAETRFGAALEGYLKGEDLYSVIGFYDIEE